VALRHHEKGIQSYVESLIIKATSMKRNLGNKKYTNPKSAEEKKKKSVLDSINYYFCEF